MTTFQNVRSILVIKDKTEHALYISQFAEYIKKGFLVLNAEAFSELAVIENTSFRNVFSIEDKSFKRTDNTTAYALYSEKPSHVSISFYDLSYTKGFILHDTFYNDITFDFNGESIELPLPIGYAYDESLECEDSERNNFTFDDDTKFSYSCGYYDSAKMIVINSCLYDREDTVILHNGRIVHQDDAVWCDELHNYYPEDDCVQLENGDWMPEHRTIRTANGEYYSEYDENVSTCNACEEYYHYEDLRYSEHNDASYCENCYEEHSNRLQNRLCYSTNVIKYHGFGDHCSKIKGKPIYIGFELECLAHDNEVEALDDTLSDMINGRCGFDYCVPTLDGSLDDDFGVEFIFKPDNLENHNTNVEHFVENCSSQLFNTAGDGYGLHVHVSNNFLSTFDKIKIQNFAAIHDSKLRFVGGRDETNYQPKKMIGKISDMKNGNSNKYQAVNISPSDTIEFRFPLSLVDHLHIMRNLQLAYSLCLYVKYHCNYTNINNFELYLDWLKTDKEFKLLSDYFAQL